MYQDNDTPAGTALFFLCVIAFLLLLTCSCGPTPIRLGDTPRDWDPRLRPYIKTFVYEMGTVRDGYSPLEHVLPVTAAFAEMPEGIRGQCHLYPGYRSEIYVDISYIGGPTADLLVVVAHELAHCVLGADHDPEPDQLLSEYVPEGPSKWSSDRWRAAWDRLVEVVP